MSHDPHLGFIAAAYALAFIVVTAMIAAIWLDHRRLKRALSAFGKGQAAPEPASPHRPAQLSQGPEGTS